MPGNEQSLFRWTGFRCPMFYRTFFAFSNTGVDELSFKHFSELIKLKYGTLEDCRRETESDVKTLNRIFTEFQEKLYA